MKKFNFAVRVNEKVVAKTFGWYQAYCIYSEMIRQNWDVVGNPSNVMSQVITFDGARVIACDSYTLDQLLCIEIRPSDELL